MVVVSSVKASETTLAVSEVSGVFIMWACAFLLGQFLAMWPCLSHSKQQPSFLYFSLSALVMAFQAVMLVSIALGSHGGSCCMGDHLEFWGLWFCCCPPPHHQKKGFLVVFPVCIGGGLAVEDLSLDLSRPWIRM